MAHMQQRNHISFSPPHPYQQHPYFPSKKIYLHARNSFNQHHLPRNTNINEKNQKRIEIVSKSSQQKGFSEPKDKVKAITEDLAKLKIQLNEIIKDANEKKDYFQSKKIDRTVNHLQKKLNQSPLKFSPSKYHTQSEEYRQIYQKNPSKMGMKIKSAQNLFNDSGKKEYYKQESQLVHRNKEKVEENNKYKYEDPIIEKIKMEIESEKELKKVKNEVQNINIQNFSLKSELEERKERIKSLIEEKQSLIEEKESYIKRQDIWKGKIQQLEKQIVQLELFKKNNFDELFRNQLEEVSRYKEIIKEKDQAIYFLNDQLRSKNKQIQACSSEINSNKLVFMTQLKQEQQKNEIKFLNKENELKSIKNTLKNMEGKFQVVLNDIKMKDEFIQKHLVGRMKLGEEQEYVKKILEEYKINFPANKILQKLLEQEKEIQKLKEKLSKYQPI